MKGRQIINNYIKEEGIKMYKEISSASYGLFHSKSATYDYKTVFSISEALELNGSGWYFDGDVGLLALNALLNDK